MLSLPDGIRSCRTMIVYYVWSFGSVAASVMLTLVHFAC